MAKYFYEFQVVRGNVFTPAELWAWKWGHWKLSAKWTSEGSPDADYNTKNTQAGLQWGQNLLMLAVPSTAQSPFAKGVDPFDKVRILTFENGNSTNTPLRTATYFTASVVDTPIPRHKYTEVLLTIENNVSVA